MMAKPYCRAVVGTVVGVATICGSASAFVAGSVATGRIASGRARPMVSSAYTPPCTGGGLRRSPPSTSGRATTTTTISPLVMASATPMHNSGSPVSSQQQQQQQQTRRPLWKLGASLGRGGRDTGGREDGDNAYGGVRGEGVRAGGGARGFRPAALLRFVREAAQRQAQKTGKGMRARIAAWRRGMSMAFVGLAAAAIVLTASASPASASIRNIMEGRMPDGEPVRMTDMPEEQYLQREQLQEFCQSDPTERAYNFRDLTLYEEELDKLDMFGDQIAVTYDGKETLRVLYDRYAKTYPPDTPAYGIVAIIEYSIYGVMGLFTAGIVGSAIVWVVRTFQGFAKEEEVLLYGEEISVDATEKEEDELEGLDDDEDEGGPGPDGEDSASGDAPVSSPPPPSLGGGGGDGGFTEPTVGDSQGSDGAADDDDDDLLGM